MSSSAVSQLSGMQGDLANSPGMLDLTDEDLAQVAGADGWWNIERMGRMREECRCGRRIRFSLTRLRVEYRLDFLHYNLRVN
ncbi:MAG TPA: hypothetical protein VFB60_12535 [Ktedonobacteraceae bacterium]|nr:hypothetical protein [Ktedonobacteraceae bacterium]